MLPMSVAQIARVCNGRLADVPDPDSIVSAPVVFDSREATPGSLFVALAGNTGDGHDHAPAAAARGAVAILANRQVGVPAVIVPDVLAAFALLARHLARQLTGTQVVAVTGSAGKTSTKDLIAHLLTVAGPTVATHQSFNNEIGLPVTVTRADATTRYLVLEMGARGVGHIRDLTEIARPDISVVLNVGTAHVGEFGGRQNIAQAKGELIEALPPGGLAVLNADDPLVRAMAPRTLGRIVTFGQRADATVRARDVQLNDFGQPTFTLLTPEGTAPVELQLVGGHHVSNALAAAAVAREAGLTPQQTASLLGQATVQSRWRMEVHELADGVTVINDAYNANPDSMHESLKALAAIGRGRDRRTVAVLGHMNELGADSRSAHEGVGHMVAELGLDQFIAIGGEEAQWMQQAATSAGAAAALHLPDQDTALALLRSTLRTGDVVLVKASRSVQLQQLADKLLQPDAEPAAG
ncbi:UDP-N-acetylmuramoyl-tripeptide--D-alanyl-D-alanine ligase [Streptomyces sp. NPDC002055]|uniref:UDP-N-acetylmuramoyl-tripeptide--D-alanyl-D- alanine ligase n=1 Tax=Streptomyces sp. NPDC002055 TaxID=3154534 RepID=UPI0033202747